MEIKKPTVRLYGIQQMQSWKFIAIQTHINKEERSLINHLATQLNELEMNNKETLESEGDRK